MASIDFTQIANLLEKDILPSVKNQLYKKAPMWEIFSGFSAEEPARIEKRVNVPGISFKNNTIYVTTQNGRPANTSISVGNKFIYGTTPTNQGSLSIATSVGAFIIPKQIMNIKAEGEIVDVLQFNMSSTVNSLAMDLNRQCYGDGTATLAYVAASGSSKTVTLKPKATTSAYYNGDIPLAVRYFPVGTPIKIGSNTATTVTAVTGDNTITVADTQTLVTDTAIVKLQGDNTTTAAEMTGLASIVGTADYMNIAVTGDATWKAYVDDNSGSPKTFAAGDLDKAFLRANTTGEVKYVIMNQTEFMKYGQSLTNNVRFNVEEALSGGWSALEYMGGNAMVILDYDCPDDRIYFLSPNSLFRAEYQALQFEPGTLNQGQRLVQQLDYEVVADIMGNIGTTLRSANAVLTNRVN